MKLPAHQVVTVHLTTHRLLFLASTAAEQRPSTGTQTSDSIPLDPNLQVYLADVRQIEYYMGFIRSSAKITLFLGEDPNALTKIPDETTQAGPSSGLKENMDWDCNVCGFKNSIKRTTFVSSLAQTPRCALCGVVKDLVPPTSRPTTPASAPPSPIPRPSLRTSHPEANAGGEGFEIPCPRCTFLNRPELKRCEVCDGPLIPPNTGLATTNGSTSNPREASASGAESPALRLPVPKPLSNERMATVRISFRKGGEKEVYKRLRTVLNAKAWERTIVKPRVVNDGTGNKGRTGVGIGGYRD
jgi:ESCRT-II complex subunit VPS36